jgi:hypothetical protein
MVWWDELQRPKPRLFRAYALNGAVVAPGDRTGQVYYPWFKGKLEWRTRTSNAPIRVPFGDFKGDRAITVPSLYVEGRGFLVLDGAHRLKGLRPRIIVLDAIELRKNEQLCAIADTIGAWWQKEDCTDE